MNVGELAHELLKRFPAQDAEEWDRPGLLVGDPAASITGVLCALDPLPQALRAAKELGANVLLTHHPAYLSFPKALTPQAKDSSLAAEVVWHAIQDSIALIALHTNLDRSLKALRFFSDLLGLPLLGPATQKGYGALLDGQGLTAHDLACLLGTKLQAAPQIWGDEKTRLERIAYLSGSMGGLGEEALAAHANAIVAGEGSYHHILDILNKSSDKNRGNVVIIIGHDVSELPYGVLLQQEVQSLVDPILVTRFHETSRWHLLHV